MYCVLYHNDHAAAEDTIYGPFAEHTEARAALTAIIERTHDPLFTVDPEDSNYAGYDVDELLEAGRDEDLAGEIWARIYPLVPPTEL